MDTIAVCLACLMLGFAGGLVLAAYGWVGLVIASIGAGVLISISLEINRFRGT